MAGRSATIADHRDHGYAWAILFCCVSQHILSIGVAFSAGIFYVEFLEAFGATKSEAALVGSMHTGLLFLPGPLVSLLLLRCSHRTVAICGSIIASTGLALSSLAKDVWTLYATYGVLGGFGLCMVYIPTATLPGEYFLQKRNLAFAVNAAGGGIGTLVAPPIISALVEALSLRGALVVTAGLTLQTCVFGALMRPPPIDRRLKVLTLKLGREVCQNWNFVALMMNSVLFNFGNLILFVIITDHAISQGVNESHSAWLISVAGLASASGRVMVAALGTCQCNRICLYIVSCCLSGVAIGVLPLSSGFAYYAACSGLFGLFFGVQLANYAIVTLDITGSEKFEMAYGFLMFTDGFGALAGPPFAGWLHAFTHGYEAGFFAGGSAIVIAAAILLPVLFTLRKSSTPAGA